MPFAHWRIRSAAFEIFKIIKRIKKYLADERISSISRLRMYLEGIFGEMIFDEHVQSLYIKILRVQNILNKKASVFTLY